MADSLYGRSSSYRGSCYFFFLSLRLWSKRGFYPKRGDGMSLSWLENQTVMLLTRVQFPNAARDFLPRVNSQCRLSFGVRTPQCAITCINICVHAKDPVVHVRVWWIMATQTYPARTIRDNNNQLDDCGHSTEGRRRSN